MKKIPVKFSYHYDLYISDEVQHVGSGTGPNCRGTVLLRDAEVDTENLTPEVQAACREAWEKGESELEAFVRRTFFPVGRAENARFWNVDEY